MTICYGSLRRSKHRKDQGYGVSRGIDFQGVENVLNFDFPPSPDAYIHRVGRFVVVVVGGGGGGSVGVGVVGGGSGGGGGGVV